MPVASPPRVLKSSMSKRPSLADASENEAHSGAGSFFPTPKRSRTLSLTAQLPFEIDADPPEVSRTFTIGLFFEPSHAIGYKPL